MRRRRLLGALGATIASAGCVNPLTQGTDTVSPDCPPGTLEFERRAVCSQTVEPGTTPVSLLPSPVETGAPRKELAFTLYNDASERIGFNPGGWRAWEFVDGEWGKIDGLTADGYATLAPGETRTWSIESMVAFTEYEFTPGRYIAALDVNYTQGDTRLVCLALFSVTGG